MHKCAAKVPLPSECRISHSSQSTYFDAVALGRKDCPCVFLPETPESRQSQRGLFAPRLAHFGDETIGIEIENGLQFLGRLLDTMFDLQPIKNALSRVAMTPKDGDEPAGRLPHLAPGVCRRESDRAFFHHIRLGCDRASAKDFHEIRAVFTRGVA